MSRRPLDRCASQACPYPAVLTVSHGYLTAAGPGWTTTRRCVGCAHEGLVRGWWTIIDEPRADAVTENGRHAFTYTRGRLGWWIEHRLLFTGGLSVRVDRDWRPTHWLAHRRQLQLVREWEALATWMDEPATVPPEWF